MKYIPIILVLLFAAIFADTSNAQSQGLIDAAAKELKAKGPETPIASLSRGLISSSGELVLSAETGNLSVGSGKVPVHSVKSIPASATPRFSPDNETSTYRFTPAANSTFTGITSRARPGSNYYLVVTTSGTSSYTLTFSTNFKVTGTLATGTSTAKVFVMQFLYDGANFNEVSRTTAL